MNDFFGIAALVTSTLLTLIGFPAQIHTNWKNKSTRGLSLLTTLFLFTNLNAWFFYGLTKPRIDWIIVSANVLGILMLAVLLGQFLMYRPAKDSSHLDGEGE
jgi:uncharacterized protein with PQ loop repeat